jgi:mono/diheme cytochrome c family protein
MNNRWLLAAFLVLTVGAGCQLRSYTTDPAEVNARYALKYAEPCSVWLKSPRTGYSYCSSPAFAVAVPPLEGPKAAAVEPFVSVATGPTDEASLKAHGAKVYGAICVTCHQADGKGVPGAFPPLAGSGSFYGDPKNHAKIIVHGLNGAITVQGQQFNGAMPPQGQLSDYDIAAVATFERGSFGNNDGIVLPEDVAAVR